MRRLRRLWAASWSDRALLIEATWLSAWSRLVLLTLPFRWISPWLGAHQQSTSFEPDERHLELLRKIGWVAAATERHVPWESKCLVQAMAARSMLARRGIEGTIYLGVWKTPEGELKAHAWLRCGQRIVTGRKGHEVFTVVSTFAFGPHDPHCPRRKFNPAQGEPKLHYVRPQQSSVEAPVSPQRKAG